MVYYFSNLLAVRNQACKHCGLLSNQLVYCALLIGKKEESKYSLIATSVPNCKVWIGNAVLGLQVALA